MIDIKKQKETIERLRNELERLNSSFEKAKRDSGIAADEQVTVDASKLSPEVKAAFEAQKQKAESEARNAVAALESESSAAPSGTPRRARRGAIAI